VLCKHAFEHLLACCSIFLFQWFLHVDESSFLSTSQVLAITKLATKENAQVVNLGDGKQLSGVEAGKPFIISQQKKYGLTTIKMDEIIRQTNTELKQAVYSATKGDIH
jgi:ATP-dependent exoDNAse (exonuclease V) alpha subunit